MLPPQRRIFGWTPAYSVYARPYYSPIRGALVAMGFASIAMLALRPLFMPRRVYILAPNDMEAFRRWQRESMLPPREVATARRLESQEELGAPTDRASFDTTGVRDRREA